MYISSTHAVGIYVSTSYKARASFDAYSWVIHLEAGSISCVGRLGRAS